MDFPILWKPLNILRNGHVFCSRRRVYRWPILFYFARNVSQNYDDPRFVQMLPYSLIGEIISTAFVESTVNQLIRNRFVKKRQIRWT